MNLHLQNNSESEKNDAVAIPTDLLIDLRERSLKFVSDFSQSDEPVRKSISGLTRVSWEEIFMKTVHQLNIYSKVSRSGLNRRKVKIRLRYDSIFY